MWIEGVPLPPLYGHFLKNCFLKRLKRFFCPKTRVSLCKQNGYGFGGYPSPKLYGQNFRRRGGYVFGGVPSPPFTDKIPNSRIRINDPGAPGFNIQTLRRSAEFNLVVTFCNCLILNILRESIPRNLCRQGFSKGRKIERHQIFECH